MPYSKTTWVDGSEPAITAERLNKIETGIDDAHAGNIDNLAIGTAKIANDAVTNAKLGSDIDAGKLTAGTLPIARIADGAVTNAKLATGIDAAKITTGTLPIARIADGAVTNAKLANVAENRIKGRVAAGTGVPTDLTAAEVRTMINVADGANNYTHPNHSGDVTSVGDGATTIANNAVSDAKLRDSSALSVIGRSANSTGDPGDIAAGTDGHVLRRAGTGLGFGQVATAGIANNAVDDTKLRDSAALSVIGRSANSTGDPADIAASADNQVLRRSGTSIGFGTVATNGLADNAVTNAKLRDSAALSVIGNSGNSTGDPGDIAASTDGHVLRRSGTALGFGQVVADGIANGVIDISKIVAAGLSKYVVNFDTSGLAGTSTNGFNNTTSFLYTTRISDYVPKSGSNLLIIVWTGLLSLARDNAGTTLGAEIQLSTGSGSSTAISGGLTRISYEGLPSSSGHVRVERVTAIAGISAGSTSARNYGIGFRVLQSNQSVTILNATASEQMFILELGA